MDPLNPARPATLQGPPLRLTVNGESRTFPSPLTCAGLVDALSLAGRRFALERNGEIVPRSAHGSTLVADGDRLEIVVAVGGG